ncbi:MAG: hypothetical protein PHO95_03835 [Bacteroidales bacterium]|nr:hypothetical protein [Bacteroidales bacterium]
MKRHLFLLILLIFAGSSVLKSQENKISYKLGGFVEFKSYYDDYRSRVSRYDHIFFYPLAPKLSSTGVDLNETGSLNFSVATSRLSFTLSGLKLLNANISTYVEADFTGSAETYIGMLNLRHAYINIEWEKSSLIFGQTDHLTSVKEVVGQTVGFGAGYPFNPLNRNMQIRFTHKFSKNMTLIMAAHMFSGHNSLGPSKAQAQAGMPNLQVQMKFGSTDKLFGGITFGYKLLKPRVADNNNLYKKTIGSYDINAFFRANIAQGYTLRLWGIYGENLSHLGMMGGYGKYVDYLSSSTSPIADYPYANIKAYSTWIDFESPYFKNFKLGIFAGYQKNLGTSKTMDMSMSGGTYLYGFYKDPNLNWFSRISPRITYTISKKLIFGLEYSLSHARWAKSVDMYFKPVEQFDVNHNNRIEFMAKYLF